MWSRQPRPDVCYYHNCSHQKSGDRQSSFPKDPSLEKWQNYDFNSGQKLLGLETEEIDASSVQSPSRVWLFATPWIAARQASLSITNSRSSSKLMSIEVVKPSSHLIFCHPLLLLLPILPSIRVFSNESTLGTRWPKYWSVSLSIIPSNEHPGLVSL